LEAKKVDLEVVLRLGEQIKAYGYTRIPYKLKWLYADQSLLLRVTIYFYSHIVHENASSPKDNNNNNIIIF
jgi:hypothetical protein